MSRKSVTALHIEWSPGWAQAVNILTGETAQAASLSELGPILSRHRQALVAISRKLVFYKTLRLPRASREDLQRLLEMQIEQLFPLNANQLSFDFIQTHDQNAEGVLTLVAAVRTEDLKQLKQELQQAGLTAVRILPIALGAPAVAAKAGVTDALVMEETPQGLTLDVILGGHLHLSRTAMPDSDPLCEAQRTMAAARAESLPMIACGSLSLPGAAMSHATPLRMLDEAPPFHFELTEDRLRAKARRTAARTRLAVLMLLSAILLVVLIWADRSDAQSVIRRGEATWARELQKLRSTRNAETAKAEKAVAMQTALNRAFQPAQPLSDIVAVVSNSLPTGAWLTGLTVERGKPVQVRGTARASSDVAQFVDRLGASPRFRDVKLVFANVAKINEIPVTQFSVTGFAVGNLPMPAPAKKATRTPRKPASGEPGGGAEAQP